MKGLLLKEFYMIIKYCKTYFLILAMFILLSFTAKNDNLFFVFYPCLISGMIPVTLLSYDEHSKWNKYCGTLPYTKTQIVSAKYWIGILIQATVLLLSSITQSIRMHINHSFQWEDYLLLLSLLFTISCVASSLSLPFMFKYGVEKGRIIYYIMIGFVCTSSVLASEFFANNLQSEISFSALLILFCIVGIGIYTLSWYLSVLFYKKREI